MERKKRVVPGEICTERPEKGKRDHRKKVALNVQKSAEAIVVERRRAESVGVPSTTGKGGMTGMAENLKEILINSASLR